MTFCIMPTIVDNNFTIDSYPMRSERLNTIQGNLSSIQSELNAPANIVTWAEDCYDVFSDLWSTSTSESGQGEAYTLDVNLKLNVMEEEYQNMRTLAISLYRNNPVLLKEFQFDELFPDDRYRKINKVLFVLKRHEEHVDMGVTTLVPTAIITRLTNALEDLQEALQKQEKERVGGTRAVALLNQRYEYDTGMLQELKAFWYAMMGKNDSRIGLIGMVNPDYSGNGSTPTPVPAAPTNLVYNEEVPSISWDPVVGATSYEVQHKTDAATDWNIIYTGTDTNLLHADPPGDYNVRIRARNDGGFGEFSSILSYTVEPIQPD